MQNSRSPISQWNPNKNKILDDRLTINPSAKDPEGEIFHISFKYYNDKICEISLLQKNIARQALKNLKTIGRCFDLNSLKANNIDILHIAPSGAYKKLFTRSITEDIDLREHKIQGTSRLYYFISSKMFYIVAFTNAHFETNKQG
ncbi:hypothetical protein KJ980_06090 [Patescibacteria group bacterium]|nr:hypothetical protein [Patescibacteria group bacterium]MBU4017255.1 hypothetical protein [Patescibacteria group bacterium]MBU4099190.1 hypothetical protein [Patescibacteria group bacterium]